MPPRLASSKWTPAEPAADGSERLQKILAAAGLGSRRKCEELILSGRVEVDRRVVRELGTKADLHQQEIRVDGVPIPRPRLVYFLVHKPPGVLSTNSDPSGRPRVIDMIDYPGRLFTVGRLDMSSEGLILVTNDGDLANRLAHPRYGIEKTYQVEVAGGLDQKELQKLRHGVHLAAGMARVVSAKVVRRYHNSTLLEIVLNEGRNREIRRLLARVGHKVERLRRIAIGPLRLADLPSGQVRPLVRDEVKKLKQASRAPATRGPRRPARQAAARPKKPAAPTRSIIGADPLPPAGKSRPKPRPKGRNKPPGRPPATRSKRS